MSALLQCLRGIFQCGVRLSRKECLVMVAVSSIAFASGVCISLQGPIYPKEAEKKGATASEYGMVFGIFELVNFILCPIYGKYMHHLGARFMIVCGAIVAGLSYILFGFLDRINSHLQFITLSFTLRIMESVGASAAFTAGFTVIATVFTKNVATMLAIVECFYGLGFALGPTIGAFLYEYGGFQLPFLVVGTLIVLVGMFIFFTLPYIDDVNASLKPQAKISSVLKMKPVVLDLLSILAVHLSLGFYLATLEPHIRQFNVSTVQVGLIFGIGSAIYMLSTPLVGMLCDTWINPKKIMIFGFITCIASFSLTGPLPFLPIHGALWMIYLGLALHGVGMACIVVPGFIDAIHSAIRCGLPDDVTTYSLVTGISTSAVAMGAFIGPSVAGFLLDYVGFRNGTLFVITIYVILLFLMSLFTCTETIHPPKDYGVSPLKDPQIHPDPHTVFTDESGLSTEHAQITSDESETVSSEQAQLTFPTKTKEYGTTGIQ